VIIYQDDGKLKVTGYRREAMSVVGTDNQTGKSKSILLTSLLMNSNQFTMNRPQLEDTDRVDQVT